VLDAADQRALLALLAREQLLRPLMLFGVLLAVFTQIVVVTDTDNFPVALLLGIVLFASSRRRQATRSPA